MRDLTPDERVIINRWSSSVGALPIGTVMTEDHLELALAWDNEMSIMRELDDHLVTHYKCECGVDTVGVGIHSDWCPKGGDK